MTDVISIITAWLTGIMTWFTSTITSVVALFYDDATSKLTFLGQMSLLALAFGFVLLVIRFVRGFIG